MSSLNTVALVQIVSDLLKQDGDAKIQTIPVIRALINLLDGSAEGQANKRYGPTTRTLASGAEEELDLSGSLKDTNGDTVVFSKVRLLYIRNTKLNTDVGATLELGGTVGTATENFKLFKSVDDIYKLGPAGVFFICEPSAAGLAVTAGTGDLLRVANVSSPAASISYEILIIGS